MSIGQFIKKVDQYLSMVKFSHTVFAMPFALLGFFLAVQLTGHSFTWEILGLILLCMVFARSAAMAFNRYIDHRIDARNPRTAEREIPSGLIRPRSALIFVVINALLFVVAAGLISRLTLWLSPVALLIILGYSFTKRFTALCHLILGLGLSLAPIGAWLSVTATFSLIPILYSLVVLTWVSGFDIIYSLQDTGFDKKLDLKSIPALTGKKNALIISRILHLFSAFMVFYAGYFIGMGRLYYIGSAVFTALLVLQHSLVGPDKLKHIGIAFGTTNGLASLIFAAFAIADLYLA